MQEGEHRAADDRCHGGSPAALQGGQREAAEEQLLAERRRDRYGDDHGDGLSREDHVHHPLEGIELLHPGGGRDLPGPPGEERDDGLVGRGQHDRHRELFERGRAQSQVGRRAQVRAAHQDHGGQCDGERFGHPEPGNDVALLRDEPDRQVSDPERDVGEDCGPFP